MATLLESRTEYARYGRWCPCSKLGSYRWRSSRLCEDKLVSDGALACRDFARLTHRDSEVAEETPRPYREWERGRSRPGKFRLRPRPAKSVRSRRHAVTYGTAYKSNSTVQNYPRNCKLCDRVGGNLNHSSDNATDAQCNQAPLVAQVLDNVGTDQRSYPLSNVRDGVEERCSAGGESISSSLRARGLC